MSETISEERYIGSVRFYKHLILSTVALMIVLPFIGCCILLFFNIRINKQYTETQTEVQQYVEELLEVNEQLEESRAQLESKAIEIKALEAESSTSSWTLVLVSERNPLQNGFKVDLADVSEGVQVDARIVGDLNAMLEAMAAEGLSPVITSAYRDYQTQDQLFDTFVSEKVSDGWTYEDAFYKAKVSVELQGTSEHQTGLAVDIVSDDYQSMDEGQADTEEAKWLAEHCEEYGFILRYPEGKENITGKDFESWHFRYVGKEVASYIMENGITLEEFVYNLKKDN